MFQSGVLLAQHTTLGLGGPARLFARCRSEEEIRECLRRADRERLAVQVLGGGSNIIFPDQGFPGLVLRVELAGLDCREDGPSAFLTAGSGEMWDEVVRWSVASNLGGIECLSGIPGLVGATPIQNVGAYGQEISDTLVSLQAVDRASLELVMFEASECDFAYRRSRFKYQDRDRYVITRATYRLRRNAEPQIRYAELRRFLESQGPWSNLEAGHPTLGAVREAVLALRRGKSMLLDPADPNARSVGSFFLNPVMALDRFAELHARWPEVPHFPAPDGIKVAAAWLVEQAGFHKGYRHKGAGISAKHALALINCEGTTDDLLELAALIEASVWDRFGIQLEREPVVVSGHEP
jgi:UDP-N-acetylmuramate dehydrogenase